MVLHWNKVAAQDYSQNYSLRDSRGRFVKTAQSVSETPPPPLVSHTSSAEGVPPLLDFKITNPITYLKYWWKRVVAGEGIDVHLRVHPVTAVVISLILVGGGYSLGHFVLPPDSPLIKYVPQLAPATPSPTPDPWKETAFQGTLRYSSVTKRYYLATSAAQAITLEVPASIDLSKLVGKRIFAVGKYNNKTDVLVVADISNLAVLPSLPIPIPTVSPTPSPTAFPTPIPIQTETPSPTNLPSVPVATP